VNPQAVAQNVIFGLFVGSNYGVAAEDVPLVGRDYATGAPVIPPISTLLERALGAPVDQVVETARDPRFLTGIIPSANTVTTANELSRFFELLRRGGELDGVRPSLRHDAENHQQRTAADPDHRSDHVHGLERRIPGVRPTGLADKDDGHDEHHARQDCRERARRAGLGWRCSRGFHVRQ